MSSGRVSWDAYLVPKVESRESIRATEGEKIHVVGTLCAKTQYINESMVSLVLRQYMRGENGTESLSCLFE